jgi:uncharacterized repeat protein (TIGR03803 family)
MGVVRRRMLVCALLCVSAATAVARAQTFQNLVNFNGRNGIGPQFMTLIQGTDGNIYGSAVWGGNKSCGFLYGCGTLFKMTPAGALTTIYTFCSQPNCADGDDPSGLVLGTDENFYGTTFEGGANTSCPGGCGTVFKITSGGVLTTLYSFSGADGNAPVAALVQGSDGNFYGTTLDGGANDSCSSGCGTVFQITPSGRLTTLHSFDGNDGAQPYANLVEGSDGNFYGTTYGGGANGQGTVFKITPAGVLTTLHSFDYTDGAGPFAGLIQASDGNFDGTTQSGGTYDYGTAFKITPAGKLTTVITFNGSNGIYPDGPLVQATDANFYGTTNIGGQFACGTVFKLAPGGLVTTLYAFTGNNGDTDDGCAPYGGLFQATNGTLYGSTYGGGEFFNVCAGGCGTIFSENIGVGPFVISVPASGKVGGSVIILGTDLSGASAVTFNGTAAKFRVVSATEIATAVPAGATTGTVQVVTPGGTLSSNVPFVVR